MIWSANIIHTNELFDLFWATNIVLQSMDAKKRVTLLILDCNAIEPDCSICECNVIFISASSSPKQYPVGLGELIPERKFQLLKRGA